MRTNVYLSMRSFFCFLYPGERGGEERETKSNISDSRMTEQEEEKEKDRKGKKFFLRCSRYRSGPSLGLWACR